MVFKEINFEFRKKMLYHCFVYLLKQMQENCFQDDVLLKRFVALLAENDASGNLSKTCTDPKEYWQIRRKLDKKLKVEFPRVILLYHAPVKFFFEIL